MPEPFYRPQPAAGCHKNAQNCPEKALKEIRALISAGVPKTLTEANRRLAAINLIATENMRPETLFEMVVRLFKENQDIPQVKHQKNAL